MTTCMGATQGERDELSRIFRADFDAGTLVSRKTGVIAGGPHRSGYMAVWVRVGGRRRGLLVHRVLWLLKHGEYPKGPLDHANGVRTDNRMCNLREATVAQNNANRGPVRAGLKGATIDRRTGRFVAQINVDGKNIFLGRHKTEAMAHEAYMQKAREVYGDFARG